MRWRGARVVGAVAAALVWSPAVPAKPAKHKPLAPAKPAPEVSLILEAPTARGPWTIRLTNLGDVPVGVAADARLLTLEVTERSAHKPVRCQLPADMRPADETERALVLPPKRSYVESFEPRLYCFGAGAQEVLSASAIVVAHLGGRVESRPPYAVWPIDGVEPEVAPQRSVASPPIALPGDPTPAPMDVAAPGMGPRLALEAAKAIDASSRSAIEIPVALRNEGTREVVVRFRPDTLGFDVSGAAGVADCSWPTLPTAPTRELFTRLLPGRTLTISVLLGAYCGGHTLDVAGLFVVRPRLDTRKASGEAIGLRSFDGLIIATRPTLVRLHDGAPDPQLKRPAVAP